MSRQAFNAEVKVTLKKAVLDPQGKAVLGSLHSMGFAQVNSVRVGKIIHLTLEADSRREVLDQLAEMSRKLLANPVIEDFHVELL
jgi:phosphoribosylformylglycinamidine synthase PurS subunit